MRVSASVVSWKPHLTGGIRIVFAGLLADEFCDAQSGYPSWLRHSHNAQLCISCIIKYERNLSGFPGARGAFYDYDLMVPQCFDYIFPVSIYRKVQIFSHAGFILAFIGICD